jgi:hypothetical protein
MNQDEYIERLAAEIAAWPAWQRDSMRPLMKAADIAHKYHASLGEFLEYAAAVYRGTDPMDLPSPARSR